MFNVTIYSGMTTSSSFDVNITNNTRQDGNKMFFITIRLISTCLPITIKSNTTSVTIIDDEGIVVLMCFLFINVYLLCIKAGDFIIIIHKGQTLVKAS